MTQVLTALADIAGDYDAVVLDQWGVLHDGGAPYGGAIAALNSAQAAGHRLAVLSNSGKRSAPNADRIAAMGFRADLFDVVMTSGEALWRDVADGTLPARRLFAMERAPGDAAAWADGLDVDLVASLDDADAVLLMGLPDGSGADIFGAELDAALARGLPLYCSNPDHASPRPGGGVVMSPGVLADRYARAGGATQLYGKPHRPIFDALATALGGGRFLMVGDSLDHDIKGGHGAGWDTLLIQGGLYRDRFAPGGDALDTVLQLCADRAAPPPTFTMDILR